MVNKESTPVSNECKVKVVADRLPLFVGGSNTRLSGDTPGQSLSFGRSSATWRFRESEPELSQHDSELSL